MLVHISNRYKDRNIILEEAKAIFPDTFVPSDFDFYTMTKHGVKLA